MRDEARTIWGTLPVLRRGVALAMVAALCACGGGQQAKKAPDTEDKYRDSLQISDFANALQTAPDEFSVITKRPLEMPDSFAALPVPEPGKASTRDPDPQAEARAALSFDPVPARAGSFAPSATEAAILSSAGPADPAIRSTLATEEAAYQAEQDIYILDRLFPSLREARGDVDPDAIDAEAERLRLLEAGVTPQPARDIATIPAASVPPAPVATPAPVVTTPVITGSAPASGTPTFGVLAPEPVGTSAPPLIYLPE